MTLKSSDASKPGLCATCGTPLREDEAAGLCPPCLLRIGMTRDVGMQLHVRCPHCQSAIEIIDDPSVHEVTCPSCDSRFSLVEDCDPTIEAQQAITLGRFQLIERVGIGAFGSVWKAQDPELDRIVAVKLPRKSNLSAAESEQFLREARAASRLKHPGIVSVHEVGREGDRIYIVSDFIDGMTLADQLSSQRPEIDRAVDLCRQIALALHHAHQQGVIHRDLKPSNIMLDSAGLPHVMDFGLAKREAAEITMTVEGRILGTPAYMSPEQARGQAHDADARSDVYSLGVILFELLTGEKPFRGTSQMLLRQVLESDAPSPRSLNGNLPRELETITLKCLEKDPSRRFHSAQLLADELQRFQNHEPIQSRPISQMQRKYRWCQRNPVVSSLALALVASLCAGLATTLWQWSIARDHLQESIRSRSVAIESQQHAETALDASESLLARVYLERGTQRLDVAPHVDLPWLIKSIETEPQTSSRREMHRLRVGLMLRDLPKLLGFWPRSAIAGFSNDGTLLAIAQDKRVHCYALPGSSESSIAITALTETHVLEHDLPIVGLCFNHAGDRLATVGRDAKGPPLASLWDVGRGTALAKHVDLSDSDYHTRDTPRLHFSADDRMLVAINSGLYNRWHSKMAARVYDSATLEPIGATFAHHSSIDAAYFFRVSPDGLKVLFPGGLPASDTRVPWVNADRWPSDLRPLQYDLLTGKPVHPPLDHVIDYYGMPVYSNDGSMIATSSGGLSKVWNASDGSLIRQFAHTEGVDEAKLHFHADGQSLFLIEPKQALRYAIVSGQLIDQWRHDDKFYLDPTSRYKAYRDPNGLDYLKDMSAPDAKELRLPDFYRVHFSGDGSRLLLHPSGHTEAGVYQSPPQQLFQSSTAKPIAPPWRFGGGTFSHSGRFLLSTQDEGIWLWDLDKQRSIAQQFPADRTSKVIDAASTHDHRYLVSLSQQHVVTGWDTETGQPYFEPFSIPPADESIPRSKWEYLSIDIAGETIAVVGESWPPNSANDSNQTQIAQVWNLRTGQPTCDLIHWGPDEDSSIDPVWFLNDGHRIVIPQYVRSSDSTSDDDTKPKYSTRLHVIDYHTGVTEPQTPSFDFDVDVLAITKDGQRCLILRQSDDWYGRSAEPPFAPYVQMFSTQDWQPVTARMAPESGFAWTTVLSPDETRLVLGNGEIWDAEVGIRLVPALVTHRDVQQIVFQEDGGSFVTVSDSQGGWDRPTEIRRFSIDGIALAPPMLNTRTGDVRCAIHPDNGVMAAAGRGLRFWDIQQGTVLSAAIDLDAGQAIGRNQNSLRSTFFSPSGNRLYIEAGDELFVVPWNSIVEGNLDDNTLTAWASVLSASRIDDSGGLVPLSADEFESAWLTIDAHDKGAAK